MLSCKENLRRLAVYNDYTLTVAEKAEKLGLTVSCFEKWRYTSGLRGQHGPRKTKEEYVSRRPTWERDIVRRYASGLERFAEQYAKITGNLPDWRSIWQYTDYWVGYNEEGRGI